MSDGFTLRPFETGVSAPLSDKRLDEILAETLPKQVKAEELAVHERGIGRRCSCCNNPIPGLPPGFARECDTCGATQ